jgi:hypothetical protein
MRIKQVLLYLNRTPTLSGYRLYQGFIFVAVALTLAMALLSTTHKQVHHDEYDHLNAARFHFEHWLPPSVGDPRTLDSYSLYGMSYLNEWDIVYLFAANFAKLIRPIVDDDLIALRLFNVALLLALACIALLQRDNILAFVLLLTSPQIWYIFSYFNADAFPLFLSFLAVAAITSPRSFFNQRTRSAIVRYLPLGIYIGLLLISKKTFWAFGLFMLCCAIWIELENRGHAHLIWKGVKSITLLGAIIIVTVSPRIGYDLYINGTPSEKASKILETATTLAAPNFKTSNRWTFQSRGIGIDQMMRPPFNWANRTAMSTFGAYNYNTIRMGIGYYNLLYGAYAIFLAYLVLAVLVRGSITDRIILLGALLFSSLVIGLSIYHSFVNDSQPQGRYLFAIFPIMSVVLARSKLLLIPALVNSFLLLSFLASIYSFCGTGLVNVKNFKDIAEINVNFRRPDPGSMNRESRP